MPILLSLLLPVLPVLPLTPGAANAAEAPVDYASCTRAARTDPPSALATALSWHDLGGGSAASHCAALALVSLGRYGQAAERLEHLARSASEFAPADRAALLAQAGQAWLQAEEPARAIAAQTAALDLAPDATEAAEVRVDRAMSYAAAARYWEAIDDLNAVIDTAPDHATARVLRASAYRFVDALDLARDDLERALVSSPDHPEGLLEYGNVLRLTGDVAGARQAWAKLVRLHEGRPAADAAQRNLEKLDVKLEPEAKPDAP